LAHREIAALDHLAHRRRQLEQTQRIGHGGAVLADALGQVLLREAVLVEQSLVRLRFLDWIQVLALQVLDERQCEGLARGGVAHHHRNLLEPGTLGSPPAPLTRNDRVATSIALPDQKRLQKTIPPDRLDELHERRFVEVASRLIGRGMHFLNGHLEILAARVHR
jgi:hypothetical protein